MQQAPDKEEFSMAPNLRGRRQENAPGFTGPPPSKDNLIAGLLLGSPEFQRR